MTPASQDMPASTRLPNLTTSSFRLAMPVPIIPTGKLKGVVILPDANLLTRLRRPPRNGEDLGDLLDMLRKPSAQSKSVMLLPGIAEMHYRQPDATPARLLERWDNWYAEHFAAYGILDVDRGEMSLSRGGYKLLFEVFYRVLSNFFVLNLAASAMREFPGSHQREAALSRFFDEIEKVGISWKSKWNLVAVSSAICGNGSARGAFHLKESSDMAELMNGSWDLYQWHCLVQLYLKSEKSHVHPLFYTYDGAAADIFKGVEMSPEGTLLFNFITDELGDTLSAKIGSFVETQIVRPENVGRVLESIRENFPSADDCSSFRAAVRMLEESADAAVLWSGTSNRTVEG